MKVDGKPQSISFFDRIESGTVNEDAQLAAARGSKTGTDKGTALPLDRGRSVVFFVDDLHLSPSSYSHIYKTLRRFIDEEIGQNDEAAVISASGQIGFLQQFTENKAVLHAAASRLKPRTGTTRDSQNPPMTEAHALAIQRGGDTGVLDYFVDAMMRDTPGLNRQAAVSQVEARAHSIAIQSNSVALNTLASLHSMVRFSSQVPGRKVFFFISDGFLIDDRNGNLRDWMRRIADASARASVVIYTLDAQGLRASTSDASTGGAFDPGGRLSSVNNGEISAMQSPLYTLAGETGGRALVNTNSLNRAVVGALKETSLYYLLVWKPESVVGRGSLKYQRIEVSVRERPDLRVIVRRGFYNSQPPPEASREGDKKKKKKVETADASASTPAPQSNSERELVEAMRAPVPRAGLPTSLALNYVNTADGGAVLTTSVELERATLTFERGEKAQANFDLFGVILDDRGKVANGFKQQMTVIADPSMPVEQQRVMYSQTARLAPGLYQVRVGTRDTRSGRIGSAMQWIEIPDFKRGQLSLSSIFLGERYSNVSPGEIKANETSSVLLSIDRRFSRTSWIRFMTFVYNASASGATRPDVALQIQLFRDDQPVFTAPLKKLTTEGFADTTRIPYAAELALASFPTGRYVLQVTAIDRTAKTSASQRTSFVIQ